MAFGRVGSLGTGFAHLGALPGGGVSAPAGGAALLTGEANGFATDFTYATDAQRAAVKTAGTVVSSGLSFFTNSGTSSKWVTNAAGTLVNVAAGSLATDYDPVTHAAKGLLCEPAATNLATQSQTLNVSPWGVNAFTFGINAIAAPDGTTTAEAFIPPSGAASPYMTQVITVANATVHTFSCYAKNGTLGTSWMLFQIVSGTTFSAYFNLTTGIKGSISGATSSNMVAVGNGWYRCDVTFTSGATTAQPYLCMSSSDGSGADSGGLGDGVRPCFYLWGTQLEVGTVPTSYIPTIGSTVTRAADSISFLLSTIPTISTEFTLYGRWQTNNPTSNRFAYCVTDNLGTPGDYAGLGAFTTARLTVADGTVTQATIGTTTIVANTSLGMAGRIKVNDFSVSINGAAVLTDVAGTQPVVTHVRFGNTGGNAAATAQFYVEKMMILPRGMSNAELVVQSAVT